MCISRPVCRHRMSMKFGNKDSRKSMVKHRFNYCGSGQTNYCSQWVNCALLESKDSALWDSTCINLLNTANERMNVAVNPKLFHGSRFSGEKFLRICAIVVFFCFAANHCFKNPIQLTEAGGVHPKPLNFNHTIWKILTLLTTPLDVTHFRKTCH